MSATRNEDNPVKEEVKEAEAEHKIIFKSLKKKRQRNFRGGRRRSSDQDSDGDGGDGEGGRKRSRGGDEVDDDEEEVNLEKLQETKDLQKLRQRPNGISHVTLASGVRVSKVEEEVGVDASDPFKLKNGGLLDLAKARQAKALEDPSSSNNELTGLGDDVVGTQFSRETRVRDEDEEMRKFIEAEMERRRRAAGAEDGGPGGAAAARYLSPEDRALLSLPEHLRKSTFRKNEEMLSSQMLSGIPEVDLGIEEKIRNIEATEEAKKKLAHQKMKGKSSQAGQAEFVPSNLAVNFRRPDRFKDEMEAADVVAGVAGGCAAGVGPAASADVLTQRTVVVGDIPQEKRIEEAAHVNRTLVVGEKATDDLHLTKFKQHFQRK